MISKRVTSKVGDIFKTDVINGKEYYLQLVYVDPANMNSDVIVVFELGNKENMSPEDIVRLPYKFYTHTTVKLGVKARLWKKVGSTTVYVEISELAFRYYREQEIVDSFRNAAEKNNNPLLRPKYDSPYWSVWNLGDKNFHNVSLEEGAEIKAEPGGIYPPKWVVQRIETGRPFLE